MTKIIQLSVESFKRLQAVSITPDGHIVRITGRNEQGKSSVLDSIQAALAGGRAMPGMPIHRGKKKAEIRLDMGEFTLIRRFTEKGDSLVVEEPSGARKTSPQTFINARLGAISFDPLAFSRASAKEQFDMLKSLVKVDVDFAALRGKNEADFEKRTEVNRAAKAFRAQADGITVPEGTPDEPIDISALVSEMEEAGRNNADIKSLTAERQRIADQADYKKSQVWDIGQEIAELEERIADLAKKQSEASAEETKYRHLIETAPPLPEPIDTAAIQSKVTAANLSNQMIDRKRRKAALITEAEARETQAKVLTDTMAARDKAKADAIAAAQMPIPDLSLGEDMVIYQGVPFEQASSAHKIRVSASIAMAMQPDIRVMLIREGSFLDSGGLKVLAQLAEANDYQVWLESVDESEKIGFVIEDGRVLGAEPEPEPKAEAPKPAADELNL